MTKLEVTHAILDTLCRVSDGQTYYRINHTPSDQIAELADQVAGWLARIGVDIEELHYPRGA